MNITGNYLWIGTMQVGKLFKLEAGFHHATFKFE